MISIGTSRVRFAVAVVASMAFGAAATVPFAIWYDGYPAAAVVPAVLVAGAVAYLVGREARRSRRERDRARATVTALADAAPQAVVEVDGGGVVVAWSDAGDVLGHGDEDRVGQPFVDLAPD